MEKIRNHTIEIVDLAQKVTSYYVSNKYKLNFSGNGSDFIYVLRGSIQHRVQAVDWHFVNLKAQHERAEEEHLGRLKKNEEWEHLLGLLSRQYFLFDDVVFNLLSLFEYIGNLMGYFWKGEQGKSLKWKGIAKSSADNTNDFSKFEIAKVVRESHRKLVTKLEDYRANIFHYQLHMGAVGTRFEFPTTGNPIKIGIAASDKFKKIFRGYSVDSKENELTAYSRLAILESYERIIDILKCLLEWPVEPSPRKI